MDHPPPPYSETDIYSNPPSSPINLTPATSQADNRSLPTPSTPSSVDDSVIFTPPYSPTGSLHRGDYDQASSTSAAAYFESRPARSLSSATPIVHSIVVSSLTEPKDLPYPEPVEEYKSKDVTEQDWATFLNYLFPEYTAGINNGVADRKLKAELIDERMHRLTLGSGDISRTNLNEVDAQLEPLRQPKSPQTAGRLDRLEETISSWNIGFFNPRGVKIDLIDAEKPDEMKVPGAWIPYENEPLEDPAINNRQTTRRGWTFGGIMADSGGFKMGPIVADNNGFRIGRTLVADGNGFRMGNMIADHSGFRLGGFVADGNGVRVGGNPFGRRVSHDDRRGGEQHYGRPRGRHAQHYGRGRSHSRGRHGRWQGRSSSTSSASSSSSVSSSDSEASLGSLPDYDDLRDQQLPSVRKSLHAWLNGPDQTITRETVQRIKEDIKRAKKENPKQYNEDMRALRKEVKGLMKEFRSKKRAQKVTQKALRKERRAEKKAERKERREARREEIRKRKGKGKEEVRNHPPWVPSKYSSPGQDLDHPPMPGGFPCGGGIGGRGFGRPFGGPSRGGHGFGGPGFCGSGFWGPGARGFSFGEKVVTKGGSGMPGSSAMHGGWPYKHDTAYIPPELAHDIEGGVSIPDFSGMSAPVSHGAESIHRQAIQMDQAATNKADVAIGIRTAATARNIGEKEKLKKLDEATALEEEAEKFRREADRLKAEATQLDLELARELDEENGVQMTGVTGSI